MAYIDSAIAFAVSSVTSPSSNFTSYSRVSRMVFTLDLPMALPCGGTLARGRVTERKRDHEGNVIGRSNANPILDTQEYEVKFEDEDVTELTANAIAESMYAMCNKNGNHILLFDAIVDHKKNNKAMTRTEQNFVDSRGKQQYKRSTKGWEVCVRWKNGSTTW